MRRMLTEGTIRALALVVAAVPSLAWDIVTVGAAGGDEEMTSLAMIDGHPAISYHRSGRLFYVRATDPLGATWGTPVDVAPIDTLHGSSSLAAISGNPAIAFNTFARDVGYVRSLDADGIAWPAHQVIFAGSPGAFWPSLAEVAGRPAVAFFEGYPYYYVGYLRALDATGSTWGPRVVVDGGGWNPSLVVVSGQPAIAHSDLNTDELRYVRGTDAYGTAWGTPVTFAMGYYPALTIVAGVPAIAYDGWTGIDMARSIDPYGTSWAAFPVCDTGMPSLHVVAGRACLALIDSTSYGLDFVKATNLPATRWGRPFPVDTASSRGCSLANVYGGPAISYLDGTNGSLKYARCAPRHDGYLMGQGLAQANGSRVRAFDGTGAPTAIDFTAYAANSWGVNVGGTVSRSPCQAEILTGPGPGWTLGPQVRGFDPSTGPIAKINYFAYGTLRFGVNVRSGDVDSDGFGEILTGPGSGAVFGPHVRGWNYDGVALAGLSTVNYFAYGTLKFGVKAGGGDDDGDGFAEILTTPGPGVVFGSQVRGWNYDDASIAPQPGVNFFASSFRNGANLAAGDVDGDGIDELQTAPGPDPTAPAEVRGFHCDGSTVSPLPGFLATIPGQALYGGTVGSGDVTLDFRDDAMAGRGPDPVADDAVWSWTYDGTALTARTPLSPFPGGAYGVTVAAIGL